MKPSGRRGDKRRPAITSAGLEKLFDRLPPHSLEAEMSLLGSLLLDASVMGDVLMHVQGPEQFYSQHHGAIFKVIRDVYDRESAVDIVIVMETLKDRGLEEAVGGAEYVVGLAESVPSARNAQRYAKMVGDKAKLRQIIDASGEILYNAYHAGDGFEDADQLVDDAESKIFKIASQTQSTAPQRLGDLLEDEMARVEEAMERGGQIPGLRTGFEDLDEMLGGLHGGEMVILAARPSMGKTALALNIAEQLAFGGRTPWAPKSGDFEPTPVGVFSLEMSREALTQRIISSRSGVSGEKLRRGDLRQNEWDKLIEACDDLKDAPLYIDDTPGMTILQMRAKARRMSDQFGIKALIVDYLQLLTAPQAGRESRQVEVSTISRQVKALARELNVPVVCLSQLNRGAEQREGHRPRMSDLRESGSIEQDADVITLLHREAYYHRGDPAWDPNSAEFDEDNREKLNLAELIIAKQRNGPTGIVRMVWDQDITRFKDRDPYHDSFDGGGDDWGGGGGGGASAAPNPFAEPPQTFTGPTPTTAEPPGSPVPTAPTDAGGFFAPGRSTGPVSDHRDGGGPDRGYDDPPSEPISDLPPDDDFDEDDDLPPF